MSFRNDRFNEAMCSMEELLSQFPDPSRIVTFSDKGEEVERLIDAIDRTEPPLAPPNLYTQKLHTAEMRLYRAGLGHLVPTLRLIVKNRGNRQESIGCLQKSQKTSWETAKHLYFSHREKILKFFLGQ